MLSSTGKICLRQLVVSCIVTIVLFLNFSYILLLPQGLLQQGPSCRTAKVTAATAAYVAPEENDRGSYSKIILCRMWSRLPLLWEASREAHDLT